MEPGNETPPFRAGLFSIDMKARTDFAPPARMGAFALHIGQHVRRRGRLELWHSLSVLCEERLDRALVVRVLVFNPDWERGLQIAELRSWPQDGAGMTPLGCNLDHISL
jgi:hypothetical protein